MQKENHLERIYSAAIKSVNPAEAIKRHIVLKNDTLLLLKDGENIKEYELNNYNRIIIIGAGKASASMAVAIEEILENRITEGLISVKYGYTEKLKYINLQEASHPIPDENGVTASKKIISLIKDSDEKDLIISLISGGGSALLPFPVDGITLEEKRDTTDFLIKSGASIDEINSIRKKLSQIKGGKLAVMAYPSDVINIIISDVVGDKIDIIASGPFAKNKPLQRSIPDIIKKYNLKENLSQNIIDALLKISESADTKRMNSTTDLYKNITNIVVASNITALETAKITAEKLGYNSIILSSLIEGDVKNAVSFHLQIAKEILKSSNPVRTPACIISGGETVVKVTGNGTGGRNMHFALLSVEEITNLNILSASIGTDGSDGPTDGAGAFATGSTLKLAKEKNLNINKYISDFNSYNFFNKVGGLIKTGPTNTNVMDIRILLVG